MSVTRRDFLQMMAVLTAGTVVRPIGALGQTFRFDIGVGGPSVEIPESRQSRSKMNYVNPYTQYRGSGEERNSRVDRGTLYDEPLVQYAEQNIYPILSDFKNTRKHQFDYWPYENAEYAKFRILTNYILPNNDRYKIVVARTDNKRLAVFTNGGFGGHSSSEPIQLLTIKNELNYLYKDIVLDIGNGSQRQNNQYDEPTQPQNTNPRTHTPPAANKWGD